MYNLKSVHYEKLDLAAAEPLKVTELLNYFVAWEKELIAPRWKSPRISTSIVEGKKVSFQP